MVKQLPYYTGMRSDRAKQIFERMTREFEEIKRSYALDAPYYGKPLQYQHRLSIDTFVYNIDVLRNERAVKEDVLHHPDPQYSILYRLEQFEQEIKEFIESFPKM